MRNHIPQINARHSPQPTMNPHRTRGLPPNPRRPAAGLSKRRLRRRNENNAADNTSPPQPTASTSSISPPTRANHPHELNYRSLQATAPEYPSTGPLKYPAIAYGDLKIHPKQRSNLPSLSNSYQQQEMNFTTKPITQAAQNELP